MLSVSPETVLSRPGLQGFEVSGFQSFRVPTGTLGTVETLESF